jgi:sirohydrochlorin ferrochelatase
VRPPALPDPPPLVAIAHGSRDLRSAATIEALTDEVRALRPGVRVETGYLDHCAPSVGQVLDRLAADGYGAVVALPLLLTAAYHAKTDVPGVLHAARRRHPRLAVQYGPTLGPDPLLVAALERRLREAGVWPGDAETAVVLASAGSSDPAAGAVLARLAATWERSGWSAVRCAFASAVGPTVDEACGALRRDGARRVVVASYFLAPGFLPDRVRAAARGADAVTGVLGAAPEVAKLVLRRYEETALAALGPASVSA